MRTLLSFNGLLGLAIFASLASGCASGTGALSVETSERLPSGIEVPTYGPDLMQQQVSQYFATFVSGQLYWAARCELWPEEVTEWINKAPDRACPLPPGRLLQAKGAELLQAKGAKTRCPCPPTCCCPTQQMLEMLVDVLEMELPCVDIDATVTLGTGERSP